MSSLDMSCLSAAASPLFNRISFRATERVNENISATDDNEHESRRDRRVVNVDETKAGQLSLSYFLPRKDVRSEHCCHGEHLGFNVAGPAPLGIMPLLTPPEEVLGFSWSLDNQQTPSQRQNSLCTPQDTPNLSANSEQSSRRPNSARPTAIPLPDAREMSQHLSSPSGALERAINALVMCHPEKSTSSSIQMVVQALPSQIKTVAVKPTFQRAAEELQQRGQVVPYLTINHALSQLIGMDQLPASPPATPNMMSSEDDYFQRQTIFTHGAAVRTYHGPGNSATLSLMSSIAPPLSVNLAVLERYIPPTSAEEVEDFFRNSHRSYLVDRLTELSTDNGALLLTYPTKKGATTFAKEYIGVILEPFIRQFVILNNLTTDAAVALGKTGAVDSIMEFEDMQAKVGELCQNFAPIAPAPDGKKSTFQIIHSEKVEVVLDRQTWMEWFVEQEAPRMRQDLIDYQKAGGRMPARDFATSPAALVREVEVGIKNSRQQAGGGGIEVGVFVIRRSSA